MIDPMNSKIALITGANKGIGLEIARQLGERGVTVLMGARDEARGCAAMTQLKKDAIDAHYIYLDVTNEAIIKQAAQHIDEAWGRLDILVNNAGISLERMARPSEVPLNIVRQVYETNVFGVVAVTNAMLPLLRRSPAARVVNVSSSMGSLTYNSDPASHHARLISLAYNSSKTALNAITLEYAKEFRNATIKFNSVSPGYCATDLNGHSGFLTAAQGAQIAVRFALLSDDGPSGTFAEANNIVPW